MLVNYPFLLTDLHQNGKSLRPVSYTHLDVYKRQQSESALISNAIFIRDHQLPFPTEHGSKISLLLLSPIYFSKNNVGLNQTFSNYVAYPLSGSLKAVISSLAVCMFPYIQFKRVNRFLLNFFWTDSDDFALDVPKLSDVTDLHRLMWYVNFAVMY